MIALPHAMLTACDVLSWPILPPESNLDFTLDVTAFVADGGGDPVESFTVVASGGNSTDLVASVAQISGNLLTVWLSGGLVGQVYPVTITATTVAGRVDSWVVWVPVLALSACQAGPQPVVIGAQGPPGLVAGDSASWVVLTASLLLYPASDPGDGTPYWLDGVFVKGSGTPGYVSALTAMLLNYPTADPGTGAPYWLDGVFVRGNPT
jgi:hypothetical protein